MRWSLPHVFLLGELEAHDIFVGVGARRRKARRVGTAMLEALQHRRHLLADIRHAVAMDEAGNSAHCRNLLQLLAPRGRQSI